MEMLSSGILLLGVRDQHLCHVGTELNNPQVVLLSAPHGFSESPSPVPSL